MPIATGLSFGSGPAALAMSAPALAASASSAVNPVGTVTSYTDANISNPRSIAAGPDDALWFTNSTYIGHGFTSGSIARIDRTTHIVTFFSAAFGFGAPQAVTSGSDGALWFTFAGLLGGISSVGRIDPATHAVTTYTDPTISSPSGIAAGPDDALWFTDGSSSIGRIDPTTHAISNYTDPTINNP
ncbi:MAG: Vgb family protein, partial [Acidimicrobiales bacterium]